MWRTLNNFALSFGFRFSNNIINKTQLGRWSLKHKCPTEDIVVFNANRDHCGDTLCGDPYEYLKLKKINKSNN